MASIKIEIPIPCHEDWGKMTPKEKGKFCGACSTTVIDFSVMSPDQIKEYLLTANKETCGRFKISQLYENNIFKRWKEQVEKRIQVRWMRVSLITMITLLLFTSSCVMFRVKKGKVKHDIHKRDKKEQYKMGLMMM